MRRNALPYRTGLREEGTCTHTHRACTGDEDHDDEEEENISEQKGGLLGKGPLQDVLKCMFDASDVDYDYKYKKQGGQNEDHKL